MINAWSLAWEALNGTMDETYPIREDVPEKLWGTPIDDKTGLWKEPQPYPYENDGLDYEVDMSTIDDQYSHHFSNAYSPYNDGWTQEYHQQELEKMDYEPKRAHFYKYHEEDILTLTNYGFNFASSAKKGNIYGVQFHPEKSLENGEKLLFNFAI